jgi:hypothetical protein
LCCDGSPELHPAHESTPDLSLYILDPRETYLRRDRFSHHRASNPIQSSSDIKREPSSQYNINGTGSGQEIWTGKGLVSWALEEPGQGKTLIIGRLVRSYEFGEVVRDKDGLDGLEGLMYRRDGADTKEEWGIEISLGLRSGGMGMAGGASSAVVGGAELKRPSVMSIKSSPIPSTRSIKQEVVRPQPVNRISWSPRGPAHTPQPLAATRVVSTTQNTRIRDTASSAMSKSNAVASSSKSYNINTSKNTYTDYDKAKPTAGHKHLYDQTRRPGPKPHSQTQTSRSNSTEPRGLPAILHSDPGTLTQDEGHRLLNHPVVIRALQGIPTQATEATITKRKASLTTTATSHAKRVKMVRSESSGSESGMQCWTCGRTNNAVWRSRKLEDGRIATLCNGEYGCTWDSRLS